MCQIGKRKLCLILIVLIATLASCSTPNVKPFADQTIAISNLVTDETSELSNAMDRAVEIEKSLPKTFRTLSEGGTLCVQANAIKSKTNLQGKNQPVTLTPDEAGTIALASVLCVKTNNQNQVVFDPNKKVTPADEYKTIMDITDRLFTELTKYSASLVSLAESGQKGEESLNQIEENINKAAALIGVVDPITAGGVAIVNKSTVFLAKQATIYQANRGLRESMEVAQPTIIKISQQFHDVFYPNAISAIMAFHTLEDSEIDKSTPGNAVKLKKKEVAFENNAFAQLFGYLNKKTSGSEVPEIICSTTSGGKCFSKISYENYVAFKEFMDKFVTPTAADIAMKRKTLVTWKAKRIKNMKTIDKSLNAWVAEHQRVMGVLDSCKGGNFKKCIEYKSIDLEVLIKDN